MKLKDNFIIQAIGSAAIGAATGAVSGGFATKILGCSRSVISIGAAGNAVFGAGESLVKSGYGYFFKTAKENTLAEIKVPLNPSTEARKKRAELAQKYDIPSLLESKKPEPSTKEMIKNFGTTVLKNVSTSTISGMLGYVITNMPADITLLETVGAMATGSTVVFAGGAALIIGGYLLWKSCCETEVNLEDIEASRPAMSRK